MFNIIANILDWWTISKLTIILKHDSLNFTFHSKINQNLTLFQIYINWSKYVKPHVFFSIGIIFIQLKLFILKNIENKIENLS